MEYHTAELPFEADVPADASQPQARTRRTSANGTSGAAATSPTNSGVAQADLAFERELWEAAVSMRGTVAPAEYKNYVLPLLFLRYLALRYQQRHAQLTLLLRDEGSDYFTGDPETDAEVLADESEYTAANVFVVPEEASWEYLLRHARAADIKLRLDTAMRLLEQRHPRLAGVLPPIYAASNLDVDQVAGLITLFSKSVFAQQNGADLLGRTYEYFISNFASTEGNRGGEFFTPSSIVRLLVEMLEPKAGKVFDPACGSGGMFVQSARFTASSHSLSFYGQERIDTTLRLCRMNLILHGLSGEIRPGNSLLGDAHASLKAQYVIANPPFNQEQWGAEKLPAGDARLRLGDQQLAPPSGNANSMWMLHFLHHLADDGTAGFVMANGAMTTSTNEERAIRRALVEHGSVDCIVQLPDKLFFGTGIPCCLWFLSKNRDGRHGFRARQHEILFVDARRLGELASRRQRVLRDADIARVATCYHRYRNGSAAPEATLGFSKVATLDEVRGHDYKLTPGIYVGSEAEAADDEAFAVKMPRLIDELRGLFAEGDRLQAKILENLEGLV